MRKPPSLGMGNCFPMTFSNVQYFSCPQADWAQDDPNEPDYIKNKDIVENVRAIQVDGTEFLGEERSSGPVNFVAGKNVILTKEGNSIIISVTGGGNLEENVVGYILGNNIPFYSGLEGIGMREYPFTRLDTATATPKDQGFYVTMSPEGDVCRAGYQITFIGNTVGVEQKFAICSKAKIRAAYHYNSSFQSWDKYDFDLSGSGCWIKAGETYFQVDGDPVPYTIYAYNEEFMGDVMTTREHWRFEIATEG